MQWDDSNGVLLLTSKKSNKLNVEQAFKGNRHRVYGKKSLKNVE